MFFVIPHIFFAADFFCKFLCPDLFIVRRLDENGAWQMIFGVNTLPRCRRRGYAGLLLQRAIADAHTQGRKGLVLTCKEKLLHYYAKFGFVNEGVSASTHGGVVWYQMRLDSSYGNTLPSASEN